MQEQQPSLLVTEAEKRVWKAVDELEEALNLVNKTPGKHDNARRRELAFIIMSFLASRYGIVPPPDIVTAETNEGE